MARHRNIRSMNYSDEYDGYDDVYGHSVEEDYCMSPSEAAFLYNRDNPQRIGAFIGSQKDIAEESETELNEEALNYVDRPKLDSCLEQMKQTFGTTISRQQMVEAALGSNLNPQDAINSILDNQQQAKPQTIPIAKKEKGVVFTKSPKGFTIPKLGSVQKNKLLSNFKPQETIDSLSNLNSLSDLSLNNGGNLNSSSVLSLNNRANFNSLSDMSKSHLGKVNVNMKPLEDLSNNHLGNSSFQTRPLGAKLQFPVEGKVNTNSEKPFNTLSDLSNTYLEKFNSHSENSFNSLSDLSKNHLEKINSNTVECFNPTPDLGKGHLGKINFNTRPFGGKPQFPTKKMLTDKNVNVNKLTNGIDKIEITPIIDLSKALRTGKDRQKNSDSVSEEADFVIPFIECDSMIADQNKPILQCTLDIKSFTKNKCFLGKGVSRCGKVICRKYNKSVDFTPVTCMEELRKFRQFNFSVPSPDDLISHYLRRK